MKTAAILMKEIETMTEETAIEILDYAMFLKSKYASEQKNNCIAIKDAYGIFKGINTRFERDEDDRI